MGKIFMRFGMTLASFNNKSKENMLQCYYTKSNKGGSYEI